jgi:hypothetical protein
MTPRQLLQEAEELDKKWGHLLKGYDNKKIREMVAVLLENQQLVFGDRGILIWRDDGLH